MATVALTGENFQEHVEKPGILIIDWWAPWCGPCPTFGPIYDKASEIHAADAVFGKMAPKTSRARRNVRDPVDPELMVFAIMVFARPGLIPGEMLDELIGKVKALDMDDVRRKLRRRKLATGRGTATDKPV